MFHVKHLYVIDRGVFRTELAHHFMLLFRIRGGGRNIWPACTVVYSWTIVLCAYNDTGVHGVRLRKPESTLLNRAVVLVIGK